ncbi:MAG: glycosyltransferase family 2 protein [Patescibacteria group bacterium]
MNLSVVVLTHNSEKTLEACLKSMSFADEVVVIDNFSEDKTLDIVNSSNVKTKTYQRELENFSSQRNFGLSKCKAEWVLFIDSDEVISPKLAKEIRDVISQKDNHVQGYYFRRDDVFLGRKLRHGETANVRLLRLAKKDSGKWKGNIHEEWHVKGSTKLLKNALLHNRNLTVSDFLERINRYSTLYSKELYQQNRKEPLLKIFCFPLGKFFYNYIIRLGLLDGFPGFAMAFLMSWHSLLVRVKLRLLWLNSGNPIFKPTNLL